MSANRQDDDLDRIVRQKLAPLRQERGECPSSELLNRYALGDLNPEEQRSVSQHVARCGVCDAILFRMRDFETRPQRKWIGWPAALGYALAAVLAIPAYRGLRSSPPPAELPQVIDLDGVRGVNDPVRVTPPGGLFVLHFFFSPKPGMEYRATLRRSDGSWVGPVLALQSWDGQGSYAVLCRETEFPKGEYSLLIEEFDRSSLRVAGSKSYAFQR